MAIEPGPARRPYRVSGRVRWATFLPLAALALAVAVGMGFLLHAANKAGWYLIVIAPIIAAVPVAALVILAVNLGQCRNRAIGGLLGLVAGVVLYLSYYEAGLIDMVGPLALERLDILPNYIWFRLQTDVIQDAKPGKNPAGGPQPSVGMNIGTFALELVILATLTTTSGLNRARKPFDEARRRWLVEEASTLVPGSGHALAEALDAGRLDALAEVPPDRAAPATSHARVAVHYGPMIGEMPAAWPVYLTIDEVEITIKGLVSKKPKVRTARVLRQVELSAEEAALLASLFPELAGRATIAADPYPSTGPAPGVAAAEVRPVPEEYAGKVLTGRHALIGNLYALSPLLMLLFGFACLGGGAWMIEQGWTIGPLPPNVSGIVVLVAGIGSFFLTALLAKPAERLGNGHLHRVARGQFEWRPDRLVDADDPDARFVEVVPRRNFQRIMAETATDIGFFKVDARRGLLLFEGDRERISIPFESVVHCEVEQARADLQNPKNSHYVAVLRFARSDTQGPAELPIAPRFDPTGSLNRLTKQARAEALAHSIREALGWEPVEGSTPASA